MTRILLVEDQPIPVAYFREIFGEVDVCLDIRQLSRAIEQGGDWAAAFIDFDLTGLAQEPKLTGLTAHRLLMQARPHTRRIAYTTLDENGRTLYAAAAYHWLKPAVVLHKASNERMLRAAASPHGANPMPSPWQNKLSQHAHLIDHLFAKYNWLALWQVWHQYNGSIRAIADHLPPGNTPNSVKTFSQEATRAMTAFKEAFYGSQPPAYERGNSALATPLVAFADANDKFFNAPDLQDILDFAKPWDRVR